jgi:hypothetical protein
MKSPTTGNEMKIRNEMREVYYKGQEIPYMHSSYYCEDKNEYFTTTELDEINIDRIIKKYKLLYE